MPAGDKSFMDTVDILGEAVDAFEIGYWRSDWGSLASNIFSRLKKLCEVHRNIVGIGSTCAKECPFMEPEGVRNPMCVRTDLIETYYIQPIMNLRHAVHPPYNPSFTVVARCRRLEDFSRGLLSELLATYYAKVPEQRQTKLGEEEGKPRRRFKVVEKKNGSVDAVVQPAVNYLSDAVLTSDVGSTNSYTAATTASGYTTLTGSVVPVTPLRFGCPDCGARFPCFDDLFQHAGDDHGHYICEYCNTVFDSRTELDNHVSEEHASYECDRCDEVFETEDALANHIAAVHRPHVCPICDREFADEEDVIRHMDMAHPDENPDDDGSEDNADEGT